MGSDDVLKEDDARGDTPAIPEPTADDMARDAAEDLAWCQAGTAGRALPSLAFAIQASSALPAWIRRAEAERRKRLEAEAETDRIAKKAVTLYARQEYDLERARAEAAGKATEVARLRQIYARRADQMEDLLVATEGKMNHFRQALERIACREDGEWGPHMDEPRAAAIAREALEGGAA